MPWKSLHLLHHGLLITINPIITTGLLSTKYWRWLFPVNNSTLSYEKRWTKNNNNKSEAKTVLDLPVGCSMIPKGCQYTIFLGFNWHPSDGAGWGSIFSFPPFLHLGNSASISNTSSCCRLKAMEPRGWCMMCLLFVKKAAVGTCLNTASQRTMNVNRFHFHTSE